MFCGILPWNWFSSSLMEASGSLVAGGNLIKKVLFPAEILPIVSVLANMVHYFLGLLILVAFLIGYRHWPDPAGLAVVSGRRARAAGVHAGLALFLSALTVHYRDIRDLLSNLLMFWFFATPIIYPWQDENVRQYKWLFDSEPVHAPRRVVPGNPVLPGAGRSREVAARARRRVDTACSWAATGSSTGCAIRSPRRCSDARDCHGLAGMQDLPTFVSSRLPTMRSVCAMNAIELDHVTKIYRRYSGRQFATLKSALLQRSILRDLTPSETFPALTDVSFSVAKGSTYGVIGRNGSGKSTALKLVAGITKPTSGTVKVDGPHLGAHRAGRRLPPRDLRARERLHQRHHARPDARARSQDRFDEIVDFAELREFIDAPVKTYSSGMYMRLGFAVAIHVDPDVLLVDEVLAVGDEGFTHKCLDKFAEFRRRNKTILLVTHSLGLVERFCDEAVWIDDGRVMGHGDPKRIVDAYLTAVERGEETAARDDDSESRRSRKRGEGEAAAPRPRRGSSTQWSAGKVAAEPIGSRGRRPKARRCHEHVRGDRRALGITRD